MHTVAFPVYTAALGGNRSLALFDGGDLGLFDGLHSRFFSNNLSMSFKAGSRDLCDAILGLSVGIDDLSRAVPRLLRRLDGTLATG